QCRHGRGKVGLQRRTFCTRKHASERSWEFSAKGSKWRISESVINSSFDLPDKGFTYLPKYHT
ncbi:MAG: hypothetical protein VB071_13530, partial [Lawsonibacter sp.]|nr:hypothetical protein [Lawsonibacter sp.]